MGKNKRKRGPQEQGQARRKRAAPGAAPGAAAAAPASRPCVAADESVLVVGDGDCSFSLALARLRSHGAARRGAAGPRGVALSAKGWSPAEISAAREAMGGKLGRDARKIAAATGKSIAAAKRLIEAARKSKRPQNVAGEDGAKREEGKTLVCSCLDTEAEVELKYGARAKETIAALRALAPSVRVLFGVDATDLSRTMARAAADDPPSSGLKFDAVVFNFPHTGSQRVHENRAMLSAFFRSAREVLAPGGRVDLTMNGGPPYCNWGVEDLARKEAMLLVRQSPFSFAAYPGYRHVTTLRGAANPNARGIKCQTLTFMPCAKPPA